MPLPLPLEENLNHKDTSGSGIIIKEGGLIETESASPPTANTDSAATVVPSVDKIGEINNDRDHKEEEEEKKKKKKRRPHLSFFRAALSLLRSDSKSKKKPPPSPEVVDDANKINSKGKWEKMVGSMRPLHLQDNGSLLPNSPPPGTWVESLELEDLNHNVMMNRLHHLPSSPSPSSVSSFGTMSQYASANNLQELEQDYHQGNDDDDSDEVFDALCGDEMIDAKAEVFIAQFYQQMKLQQRN